MNKITKFITDLLETAAFWEIEKAVKHIEKNINCAPVCCEKPMEYIGEHSGHCLNTQFYQCQSCKRLELLHKHDWEKS